MSAAIICVDGPPHDAVEDVHRHLRMVAPSASAVVFYMSSTCYSVLALCCSSTFPAFRFAVLALHLFLPRFPLSVLPSWEPRITVPQGEIGQGASAKQTNKWLNRDWEVTQGWPSSDFTVTPMCVVLRTASFWVPLIIAIILAISIDNSNNTSY